MEPVANGELAQCSILMYYSPPVYFCPVVITVNPKQNNITKRILYIEGVTSTTWKLNFRQIYDYIEYAWLNDGE